VVYTRNVQRSLGFYSDLLDFVKQFQFPPDQDDPGYVSLRRDEADLGIVHESSPQQLIGQSMGEGPRFELFVYVDDVDGTVDRMRVAGVTILRDPADMPWGERVAYVTDPDGNPVTLAAPIARS
jgi:lactoylglutathione lyase